MACEIKRKKSRNINDTITRQIRECLIKLYCTIGKIQTQRENPESEKVKKQLEEIKKTMVAIQEENKSLRRELEQVKKSIFPPPLHQRERIKVHKPQKVLRKKIKKTEGKKMEMKEARRTPKETLSR